MTKKGTVAISLKMQQKKQKRDFEEPVAAVAIQWRFWRERIRLLSKNTDDPTVGRLRDKKEKCPTRRGFRVGIGFREFLQTL